MLLMMLQHSHLNLSDTRFSSQFAFGGALFSMAPKRVIVDRATHGA